MTRVRVSTTVDATILERARMLMAVRDGEMLDAAMRTLCEKLEGEAELSALDAWPYAVDPDLLMPDAPDDDLDALPYDGEVPRNVLELALARRRRKIR